jgi:hypothetical protein
LLSAGETHIEGMMTPQRVTITGPNFHETPGMIVSEPHVGDSLQMFLDNGKVMRTSAVKRVSRTGDELVVETLNSRYRVVLA